MAIIYQGPLCATLPCLKPTRGDDIPLIIAQSLNIDISHVYTVSKPSGAV